jgi:hypothetical protein
MRILASIGTLLFAGLLFAAPSRAQKVELFGGYSFVRAPVTFVSPVTCPTTGCPPNTQHLNLNGWEVSGAVKLFGPLGLAADFSDTSGSFQGANARLKTYLFGPQIRFPGPVSPFAHFLVGGAHESIDPGTSLLGGPTQNTFATAIGAGLDLKVLPFISIRPIQFDYLLTHFNSTTQNQPRVSAGVVVHF